MKNEKSIITVIMSLFWLKSMDSYPGIVSSLLSSIGYLFGIIAFIYGYWNGNFTIAFAHGACIFVICQGLSLMYWICSAGSSSLTGISKGIFSVINIPASIIFFLVCIATINYSFSSIKMDKWSYNFWKQANSPEIIAHDQKMYHDTEVKLNRDEAIGTQAFHIISEEDAQAEAALVAQRKALEDAQSNTVSSLEIERSSEKIRKLDEQIDAIENSNLNDPKYQERLEAFNKRVDAKTAELRKAQGLPPKAQY